MGCCSSDRSCAHTGQTAGQTAGQPCVLSASIAGVGAPSPWVVNANPKSISNY